MIPAQLVDVDLELDVLTSIPRAPTSCARVFLAVPEIAFAFAPHRYLYVALRALGTPRLSAATGDWHIDGLIEELERLPGAGDPDRAAARLYEVLDHAPLLPFGDKMLDRLIELTRRRGFWARLEDWRADTADRARTIAVLELIDSTEAAYLAADPLEDVADLEDRLTTLAVTP